MSYKIWLSPPHMGEKERAYVNDAFQSNWIAPLGPYVDGFEKKLATYTGAGHAAALSSGTAALHLALLLSGVERNDDVLCSSFTFSATVNPIVYLGANPVFIDSEAETWNMSPDLLRKAISQLKKKPRALIIVHLYGMPAKMDELLEIAHEYEITIIEDAAESLGSRYKSRHTGTFGKAGILSFNGNKIITTSGGGALISDDESLIKRSRFLATQARDPAPHYQHSEIGYNYRLSNICGAIGCGQMEILESHIHSRRNNFEKYVKALSKIPAIGFLKEPEGSFSNRWLTTITVDPGKSKNNITREDIRLALNEMQIESRPLWKPMHLQPVFKDYNAFTDGTSEKLFETGLCLPSGSALTDEEHDLICRTIKRLFE